MSKWNKPINKDTGDCSISSKASILLRSLSICFPCLFCISSSVIRNQKVSICLSCLFCTSLSVKKNRKSWIGLFIMHFIIYTDVFLHIYKSKNYMILIQFANMKKVPHTRIIQVSYENNIILILQLCNYIINDILQLYDRLYGNYMILILK